jgi:hypothetical protein
LIAAGGAKATVADLYGIVSLMLRALVMAVTVKYPASWCAPTTWRGGGIFALLAIVPERFRAHNTRKGRITAMAMLAVVGASLLSRQPARIAQRLFHGHEHRQRHGRSPRHATLIGAQRAGRPTLQRAA